MKRNFFISFFILGITSIIAQLAIIGEVFSNFYSDEFFIGLTVGFWFIWLAIGAIVLAKALARIYALKVLVACHFIVPFIFLAQLVLIRLFWLLPAAAQSPPDLFLSLGYLFIVSAPLGLLLGLQFAVLGRLLLTTGEGEPAKFRKIFKWIWRKIFAQKSHTAAYLINQGYIYQLTGLALGGLTYYFLLAGLNPVTLFFLLIIINFFTLLFLVFSRIARFLLAGAVVMFLFFWLSFGFDVYLNSLTKSWYFSSQQISVQKNSPAANSAVIENGSIGKILAISAASRSADLSAGNQQIGHGVGNLSWISQKHPGLTAVWQFILQISLVKIIIASLILFLVIFYILDVLLQKQERTLGAVTIIPGLSLVAAEIILIFNYQILFGHVYQQLGLIFAAFFTAAALGAHLVNNLILKNKARYCYLFRLYFFVALYFVSLALVIAYLNLVWQNQFFIFGSVFIAGLLIGLEFPLVNKFYLDFKHKPAEKTGIIYGLDLVGWGMGAILAAIWLLPGLGFFKTFVFLSLLNFLAFATLFFLRQSFEKE